MAITSTMFMYIILILSHFFCVSLTTNDWSSVWHYECINNNCEKYEILPNITEPQAFAICQLFCGKDGSVWPKPTGHINLNNEVVHLNRNNIIINDIDEKTRIGRLLLKNIDNLKKYILHLSSKEREIGSAVLNIQFNISQINDDALHLTLTTKESYILVIKEINKNVNVTIISDNYFGARHALETLHQLIVYDDLHNKLKIASNVYINDKPAYPYRGILLDTSRNFIDKKTILRTIEGMGMSKLNVFHWHIVDSQSFPYVSKTWPMFSKYGAYSANKVYTSEDIEEIVEFGLLNGVNVIPEIDVPAHIGEGWQWVGDNISMCFNKQPWSDYCYEPPCGLLNPTKDRVYEILEGLYKDMLKDFKPTLFHMGGDEVKDTCWLESEDIRSWVKQKGWNIPNYFLPLWNYFQRQAYKKLIKANNYTSIPAILWTSELTKLDNLQYMDNKHYIFQVWAPSYDKITADLLNNNFRIIISHYDKLYLDCGYSGWLSGGLNWCSPYKGWQSIYEYSPLNIFSEYVIPIEKKKLILGSEAALWSEQVDSAAVDSKLWPRCAALSERLWSEPTTNWIYAQNRFLLHRQRMIQRGIKSDAQQPEWCLHNQGYCDSE